MLIVGTEQFQQALYFTK